MAENHGAGKWQIAFWIMCVVCVGGLLTMTGYVVANDVKREEGDSALVEKIHHEGDKLRKEFKEEIVLLQMEQKIMRKESNAGFAKVNVDLTKVLVAIEKIKK